MKLWNYLKNNMMLNSNQVICENNAQISFEELVIWAEIFSKKLKGLNSCAILCQSEMMSAMAVLTCVAAGVTAIPMSTRYGTKHCKKILDKINPEAIITDYEGKLEVVVISDNKYIIPKKHPAFIMCTSGTTGDPKGVMLSEKNIITNVNDIVDYLKINEKDSILIARPLYHCAVLTGEFFVSLVKGCKIRFYSGKFNPNEILTLIQRHKVTTFCGTPTLLYMMSQFIRNKSLCPLKNICISGECMDYDTGKYISNSFHKADIYHVYGLTEASPRVSYLSPNEFYKNPNCVGKPLKSVALKIINEKGQVCKIGEEGELWIKGDSVMIGYYMDEALTNKVYKNGWLFTGDIALTNEKGLLHIKGRKDNLIIKGGMNIYPAEIENTLKSDPRVKNVIAYGYKTKFGTQIGLKISGEFSSSDDVKKLCFAKLPTYQLPTMIDLVDEIPYNASGKLERKVSLC